MKDRLVYTREVKYSNYLTSFQIWKILNGLVYKASIPLLDLNNNFLFELLSSVVALCTSARRKISSVESEELLIWAANNIILLTNESTINKRHKIFLELLEKGIERNIVIDHITTNVSTISQDEIYPIDIYKLDKSITVYLNMYEVFRKDIFNRYYDMMLVAANKNFHSKQISGLNISKNDVNQIYTIAVYRAIDKFVPFKGTLTSYIQTWFQFAEGGSAFALYDNEAVSINREVRRKVQDESLAIKTQAVNLDKVTNFVEDTSVLVKDEITTNIVKYISKLENVSLLFLLYNLPYKLSDKEKELIQITNKKV